jgi:DNA-binding HxlR family transcriptional regulator
MAKVPESSCSIARSLGVLGERWTFLILREAFLGATKFAEFRDRLGIAPDVLSDRLSTLVQYGVMERDPYQEPGARSRLAYRLTPAGRELQVVLSALQQWGDAYLPRPEGPSMLRRVRGTDLPVHVGYVNDEGNEVTLADVAVIPADPARGQPQGRQTTPRARAAGLTEPAGH